MDGDYSCANVYTPLNRKMRFASRLLRAITLVLAATGALFLFITFSPFVSWYALRLAGPWYAPVGDVLVVLSAAGPNMGVMDPSTYWRCAYAVEVNREHPFRKIIVSGKAIAPQMRDLLVFSGVPAERIIVENESSNTHENAVFSARILKGIDGRKILMTSDVHTFRAERSFLKQGAQTVPSPIPDVIKRANAYNMRWELFANEVGETAGIVYYWLKGWI